jgi:arylsulfatase A-like enzyme
MKTINSIFTSLFLLLIAVCLSSCLKVKENEPPKKPNIVFCLADDATWKHMSAYGSKWINTPAFDRVAAEGLLFNNAYTPNGKCAPSRAIILTGRNSWQLEEAANHLAYFPQKFKSYQEGLAENGYDVGYTGKGWSPGTTINEDGSKRDLLVNRFSKIKKETPTKGINTVDYVANFESFLRQRDADSPFCFWYGGHEPHRSYEHGTGVSVGNKKLSQIDSVFSYWPQNDVVKNDMLDYAFELEYFDQQLGGLLKALEDAGELDNTIVVVTADNGMPFPRAKGLSYEHSNHMPLAIMWKNGIENQGRVIEDYISFTDFAATFIDLAGYNAEDLEMQPVQGRSLLPYFNSDKNSIVKPEKDYVLLGQERHDVGRPNDVGYPIRGIVKDGFMYLINYKNDRWPAGNPETGYTNTDGSPTKTEILNLNRSGENSEYWEMNFGKHPQEELYQVNVDEDCIYNLASKEEFASIKKELKNILESELKLQNDPRIFGNGDVFDNYTLDRNVHFYEDYMSGKEVKSGWINDTDFEKN